MNQSEFNKHLKKLEKQKEKDIKIWERHWRIKEKMRRATGFRLFIYRLQETGFKLQHPFHTAIPVGTAGFKKEDGLEMG